MGEMADLNKSVKLLLEHSMYIQNIKNANEDIPLSEKLQHLKLEICKGLEDGSIVPEMKDIVSEIENIQKDIHIQKVKNDQIKSKIEYEAELDSEWVFVDTDELENYEATISITDRLGFKYREVCENINHMRQPIKPLFLILQWLITVYTTGLFSIIPILLKLLSQ